MARSNKYRVWDTEDKHYLEANVFLAPDGYLYSMEQYSGWELLTTRWFNEKMLQEKYKGHSSVDYTRITKEVEAEIRQQQQEWFIVEFATDYPDKKGTIIYDGDIVKADWHWTEPHQIVWPYDQYDFLEYSLDSGSNLEIIGNVHETPELIPQEQIAGS